MKPVVFAIILLVTVLLASLLFMEKFKAKDHPLDEIKIGLSTLRPRLSAGSLIGCVASADRSQTVPEVANALVPVTVVPYKMMDTSLLVFDKSVNDSLIRQKLQGNISLWHNTTEHYTFFLVTYSK